MAIESLLADGVDFDGIVAATDDMAMAAMQRLVKHGRRIPDDVAVVGFDDSHAAEMFIPSLTSVYLDGVTMGRIAIDILDELLRNTAPQRTSECRLITPSLVVRESCGAGASTGTRPDVGQRS